MLRQTACILMFTASLTACGGESLRFSTWEKGEVDFGDADTVVLIDGYGAPGALDELRNTLTNKFQSNGYFGVRDESHDRAILVHDDDGGLQLNNQQALPQKALTLEVDILERFVVNDYVVQEATDEAGNVYDLFVPIRRAEVRLDVYLAADDGFALMNGVTYHAVRETEDVDVPDVDLLRDAADAALAEIVSTIAPHTRTHAVPLDSDDESLRPMIDIAQGGDLDAAIAMADERLAQNPQDAAVLYNKAVFLDAQARYADALETYDTAIGLDAEKAFYREARNDCYARQRAAAELAP